jgi:hypothetical protein
VKILKKQRTPELVKNAPCPESAATTGKERLRSGSIVFGLQTLIVSGLTCTA